MAKNYINNYKRRFYNHKLRGIYSTAIALDLAIFFVVLFTMNTGDWEMTDFGYFMLFGLLAGVLFGAIVYADRVRLKRITDDVVGKRIPGLNEEFWVSCINKSTVALVLWEILFFTLLYQLSNSGAPEVVIFVMFVLMIAGLVEKLRFNRKVKEIRQRHLSFGLGKKEYPIAWKREMFMEVFSAVVLEVLMIVCLIIEGSKWGELEESTVIPFLVMTAVLVITLTVRLRNKVNLRDEDGLQEWIEKHKQPEKKAVSAQTKQAEQSVEQTAAFSVEEVAYEYCESFSALARSFGAYAEECGLHIDEGDCRNIVSAMAASRAIWLHSENEEFTARVAKVLGKYFTGKAWELHLRSGATTVQEMVQSPVQNGRGVATTLFECLYKAKRATNSVNVLTIYNAEVENFEELFKPFIKAFRAPEGENRLKIDYNGGYARYEGVKNSKIVLPSNLWYIFVGSANKRLNKTECEYATAVKLRYPGEMYEDIVDEEKLTFLSFARYNELLNESLASHFLPLEIWKKFDRIEEYLQEQIPFEITNPLARQMEQYSSVQLACGQEQDAVIDTIIESRLFPLLEGYTKENVNQEGSTFAELLDGLFGMDNLPLTHKALLDKNLG